MSDLFCKGMLGAGLCLGKALSLHLQPNEQAMNNTVTMALIFGGALLISNLISFVISRRLALKSKPKGLSSSFQRQLLAQPNQESVNLEQLEKHLAIGYIQISDNNLKIEKSLIPDSIIFVGRDNSCDIILKDHSIEVKHCCFTVNNNELIVENLGTGNGVYINGEVLVGKQRLRHEDQVFLGNTSLIYMKGKKNAQPENIKLGKN